MSKTKSELLEEAKELNLEVSEKNTVAEITEAIKAKAETTRSKTTAKAGKRSEKSQRETAEKLEKEARKAEIQDPATLQTAKSDDTKKVKKPVTRPKIERRGKKYRELAGKIDQNKKYSLDEALKLASETNPAKFDASVEIHVLTGVDPRQADQNIRATVSLPHGTGKTIKIAAFVSDEEAKKALDAGADIAGEQAILELLDKQQLDFDVLISTPQLMPKLGKYARVLGPRGLMPNPKSGTVSANVASAVKEAKAGKVEFRVDKQAIVHLAIGKVSFNQSKLLDNAKAFLATLQSLKPSSLKGSYLRTITISSTMGPGVKVDMSLL
jgi:large subunit ribosomal protein L1